MGTLFVFFFVFGGGGGWFSEEKYFNTLSKSWLERSYRVE